MHALKPKTAYGHNLASLQEAKLGPVAAVALHFVDNVVGYTVVIS